MFLIEGLPVWTNLTSALNRSMGMAAGTSEAADHHSAVFSNTLAFKAQAFWDGIPIVVGEGQVVRQEFSLALFLMDGSPSHKLFKGSIGRNTRGNTAPIRLVDHYELEPLWLLGNLKSRIASVTWMRCKQLKRISWSQETCQPVPPHFPLSSLIFSLPAFHAFSVPAEVKAGICWNRVGKKRGALEKASSLLAGGNRWQSLELGEWGGAIKPIEGNHFCQNCPIIKNCKNALSQKKRS